ncbi:putative membrane protein [Salmonella enterica subsp. enterica serovar Heidelberg]|nr:putative membrane protein [Salmonella enterica subsp. enterica serovar Heidelberg]
MIGIVLVLASLLSVGGQLCQKQATRPLTTGGRRRHLMLWLGLALICMGAAMVLWLLVLQNPAGGNCLPDVESEFCLGHAGGLENLA